ncbi:MAG: glycosyltransferase family 4 protein [Sphingosinicella sp.]|nr:glycosyltransferase family 4 protein [Sphingosinicella sp.]
MKLLIFSFYFPPDLCAGSFRCGALVEALQRSMPDGMSVDVVTTQPNRYKGTIPQAPAIEQHGSVRIHRIDLPQHDSGMADQARSFVTFGRKALAIARRSGPHDAIFATSSRLMTAALGAWLSKRTGAPLYLDIRDLFPETMSGVLKGSRVRAVLPAIERIEKATFSRAETINVVSPGFLDHMRQVAPTATLRTFTNGIDDEFLALPAHMARPNEDGPPVILYAGNIGESQGLHNILPEAARRLAGRARFRIIGNGGRLAQLREGVAELDNVELRVPVPREQLLAEYAQADILFLHLNDQPAFLKVLPSKLFEYGALGHPILAGLAGVSADFVERELPDAAVFDPCDVDSMMTGFERVARAGPQDRSEFKKRFARDQIMREMADDLISFTAKAAERRGQRQG